MTTNFTRAAGFVLVFVGTLMITAMAETKELKWTHSGWFVATEIDINKDGRRADSGTSEGTGTFGKFTVNSQSETDPVPLGKVGSCAADSLEFKYTAFTTVIRFQNGDLLFERLDPNKQSIVCFNSVNFNGTYIINKLILGGTGRFEGAVGRTTATGKFITLAGDDVRITHGASMGSSEGEIFLSNVSND